MPLLPRRVERRPDVHLLAVTRCLVHVRSACNAVAFPDSHLLFGLVRAAERPKAKTDEGKVGSEERHAGDIVSFCYVVDNRASLDWYVLNVAGQ